MSSNGFFVTIPHSGEEYPPEAHWMKDLDPIVALRDVDRFVSELYSESISESRIPNVTTPWSRYVVDLNRSEDEFDCDSVEGASNPSGTFPRGLHWSVTTRREKILPQPMSKQVHDLLMKLCFNPFHEEILRKTLRLRQNGAQTIYHLDLHSMPSIGTSEHKDPGERRADIVISDFHGKSASSQFLDMVVDAYKKQGFTVRLNWPYIGGGITQRYGNPASGHHTVQVELNRALYMDEETKEKNTQFKNTQQRLKFALNSIAQDVLKLDAPLIQE